MDDAFLPDRHRRRVDFHAKVAARHHDRVGRGDDLVVGRERLLLLDLGDHELVAAGGRDELLELANVVGAAHERERHVVDILAHAPGQQLAIGGPRFVSPILMFA